jgi:ubiquinone/menaquinone biosynthesis C-methylase UbiE
VLTPGLRHGWIAVIGGVQPDPPVLRRQYVKFCDVRDFEDPVLRARIRSILPGFDDRALAHRKHWEYATLTLFIEDVGKLDERAEVLSVGAGREEVVYWLANRVGRVVAADIYGAGEFAGREATASMLTDPGAFAPYPYRVERLEIRSTDARALEFADESFDVVYSLSSIEHFGSSNDIARAAREIGRVLKRGGYAFVVTECFLRRHPFNSRLVQTAIRAATLNRRYPASTPRRRSMDVLTPAELERLIVRPSGLELVQPFDRFVSHETWDNVQSWVGGELRPATGDRCPHVILELRSSRLPLTYCAPWTSVALALQKPA